VVVDAVVVVPAVYVTLGVCGVVPVVTVASDDAKVNGDVANKKQICIKCM